MIGRTNIGISKDETSELIYNAFYLYQVSSGTTGSLTDYEFLVVKNHKYVLYCGTTQTSCTLTLSNYTNLTLVNEQNAGSLAYCKLFKADSTGIATISCSWQGSGSGGDVYTMLFDVADSCNGDIQTVNLQSFVAATITSPEKICYFTTRDRTIIPTFTETLNDVDAAYISYPLGAATTSSAHKVLMYVLKDTLQITIPGIQSDHYLVMIT